MKNSNSQFKVTKYPNLVDSESNNEKIDEDSDDKYGRHDKSRAKLNRDANSSFIAFKSPNKKKRKNHKQKHKSK